MARPMVPPTRPSVASARPRSRYSRKGRRPLRVQLAPSSRDTTILGFSLDMIPPVDRWTATNISLGGLWPVARYNRRKRRHPEQALRANIRQTPRHGPAVPDTAGREGHDEIWPRGALSPGAQFWRARADRRLLRLALPPGIVGARVG